jgi:transcription-repair coupling factor (superfamily II helicase)
VAAVGFELYVEMLQEAVAAGAEGAPPERDVRVEAPVSAYIPSDYVPVEQTKIELHRRIARAADRASVAALRAELEDRFGPVPPPVDALLAVQRLRVLLRELGADHLAIRAGTLRVGPVSLTSDALRALRQAHPRAAYASREGTVSLPVEAGAPGLAAAEAALATLVGDTALAA